MALARSGADVVAADVDDVESLKKAFRGAHAAYCVTFFWDHFSPDREKAQAHNMAVAAKDAGVKHVIWSTFEDTRLWCHSPTTGCRPSGEVQGAALRREGRGRRVLPEFGLPTTFLLTSFYWDNLIHFGMGPKKGPDGKLAFTCPSGPGSPGDCGGGHVGCAYGLFRRGAGFIGKTVGVAGSTSPARRWRRRSRARWGRRSPTTRCLRPCTDRSVSRGRRPGQHVPVQGRFESLYCGTGTSRSPARSTRGSRPCPVARGQQGPNPIG